MRSAKVGIDLYDRRSAIGFFVGLVVLGDRTLQRQSNGLLELFQLLRKS